MIPIPPRWRVARVPVSLIQTLHRGAPGPSHLGTWEGSRLPQRSIPPRSLECKGSYEWRCGRATCRHALTPAIIRRSPSSEHINIYITIRYLPIWLI
jgi:hypothetical protein